VSKSIEKWPRQPFVGLALAAALGIIWADWAPNISNGVIVVITVVALLALLWHRSVATYAFVAVSFYYLHSLQLIDTPGLRLVRAIGIEALTCTVRGAVISEPKLSPNGFLSFLFRLQSLETEKEKRQSSATIFVRSRAATEFGDELQLSGITGPVPPPRNPGTFDMRRYLARSDVYTQLFVSYEGDRTLLRHHGGNPVLRAAQKSRRWLQKVLSRGIEDSPEVEGLITGMVLGLRHQTPEDIEEPFQQTGTLHLFAVAGLHVGIVAQLLWIVATVAQLRRRLAIVLIIPALLFYAAITGLHVSSVRAALMSSVLLAGFLAERRVFTLNSLAAAAVLILCWDTNQLFSLGFQLSFAVVTAIILLSGPVFRWLSRLFAADPFLPRSLFSRTRRFTDRLLRLIAGGLSVSCAAWIGSLPLMLWYYNLVTPISLVANLLVVPIAFFILAGGLLSMVAAPISSALSIIFNNCNWLLAQIVLGIVHFLAQLPTGHFYAERPHLAKHLRAEITVLDVGTGGAAHVRTRTSDWLFDAGAQRDYNRVIRDYLRHAGINRLDGLLLSHGDAGHLGGASALIHDFRPRTIVDSPAHDRSPLHRALLADLTNRNLTPTLVTAGDELPISQNVTAQVLFPAKNFQAKMADDQALVVQLLVDKIPRILFVSDSGTATEQKLLQSGMDLRSEILIKGQHHSGVSGSPEFITAVNPRVIVATSRSFPISESISEEWAATVRGHGIKLFRQDESGAVELEFFENGWLARSYFTGETFRNTSR
jgi:ComEC/Rec2-related protein